MTEMDNEFQIEHHISYAFEYKWGYLKWAKSDNPLYRKIFPEGTFDIVFEGELIKNRKVNWDNAKLSLHQVKNKLQLGTVLIIHRSDNLVEIKIKKTRILFRIGLLCTNM